MYFTWFSEKFIYLIGLPCAMITEMDIGTATITSKNMVVIPKKAREKFNLKEGQKLRVFVSENEVILSPLIPLEELIGILKGPQSAAELIREGRKNESRFD